MDVLGVAIYVLSRILNETGISNKEARPSPPRFSYFICRPSDVKFYRPFSPSFPQTPKMLNPNIEAGLHAVAYVYNFKILETET